jgi:hypothetical protein
VDKSNEDFDMRKLLLRVLNATVSVVSVICAGLFLLNGSSAQAFSAKELPREHQISQVTDYGDGITVSDYADQSGFEAEGGNCLFIYRFASKELIFINEEGVVQTYSFSDLNYGPAKTAAR